MGIRTSVLPSSFMGDSLKACCWELFRGPQPRVAPAPTPSFALASSTGLDIGAWEASVDGSLSPASGAADLSQVQ